MKLRSLLSRGQFLSLAAILSLTAGDAGAGGIPGRPYDPRLIVPTPILRRHACGTDHAVPSKRGLAILSPLESPDHCDLGVGGKTIYTHYYPDYCPHRWHGPRVFVPGNGVGYRAPHGAGGPPWVAHVNLDSITAQAGSYGGYAGASQNENALLHLGGNSGAEQDPGRPIPPPDVIDLIETSR